MAFRPQTFANVEDPQELRRYLLELQQELARALGETNQLSPVVTSATYAANYDEIVRIDPPTGGTTVILPPPSIAKAGSTVTLTVVGDGGQVTLECVGGQVNNASSFAFQAGVGDVVCRLDGPRGWFIPSAELSSSGPADAQYYVGAADGSLPNARLGTASTEITPSHAVSNVVTWALNTASVVLAKLQDLTGLSVLGRAANSTGVMAAITASAARQTLTVNDAGTSLAWGDPVEVRERGTDVGDAYAIDVVSGNSVTAHASVASRVASLQFNLAHNRAKTETGTGVISTADWADYDVILFTGSAPEVQNVPVPLDPDGNPTAKRMILLGGTTLGTITVKNNTGSPLNGRLLLPNLEDVKVFRVEVLEIFYQPAFERWFVCDKYGVKTDTNGSASLLTNRYIDFRVGAGSGLSVSQSNFAGSTRLTYNLDDLPLTRLADQADDTGLRNISGSPAPPTASALSSWVDGTSLEYNASAHAWRTTAVSGAISRAAGSAASLFAGVRTNGVLQTPRTHLNLLNTDTIQITPQDDAGNDEWELYPAVRANSINGTYLAQLNAGEVWGRQVDAGGSPGDTVPLTGLEQGENVRFNTISVIALTPGGGSGAGGEYVSTDFASNITSTTTHVVFTMTGSGTAEIDGFPAITGKMLFVRASTLASDQAISWTNLSAEQASVDGAGRIRVAEGPRVWDQTGASGIVAYGNSVYDLLEAPPADGSIENAKLADGSATGQIKQWNGSAWTNILLSTAVDSDAPGRLIAFTQYDEGESGTHAVNSATTRMLIERQGAGGGAGGVQGAAGEARHASGGGAGGYELEWDTDPQTGSHAYSVGTRGTGGLGSTAASGGNGGATSYRGVANGGSGSAGVSTNANPQSSVGAGGSAGLGLTGGSGSVGWAVNSTSGPAIGGDGGGSVLGQGGKGGVMIAGGAGGTSLSPSNNNDATGYGGGGGGGAVINSINDSSGGDGGPGVLRIWEFS